MGPVMLFVVSLIMGTDHLMSTYRVCFLILGIPALITIALVLLSCYKYPHPEMFDQQKETEESFAFRGSFVMYMIAICLFAFGFVDFTLITLHSARAGVFPKSTLSLLYALAMAIDAVAALFFGGLFDKVGLKALMISTLLSSVFACFVFLTNQGSLILVGIILWGIGMGAQESIMKAAVSKIVPRSMRGTGFGIFETGFGIAWFLGSWAMGALYDVNVTAMVVISVTVQLLAILFYALSMKTERK